MIEYYKVALALLLLVMGIFAISPAKKSFQLPEYLFRKIFHIGFGIVLIGFSYFLTRDECIVIASIVLIFRLITFVFGWFKEHDNIQETKNYGTLLWSVSFLILSIITPSYLNYIKIISLAVVTFGDSLAAIVGHRSTKKHIYFILDHERTLEGSLSMFAATLTICVALLSMQFNQQVSFLNIFLVSVSISLLLTAIEAVSINGMDNFLLPMIAYLFLYWLEMTEWKEIKLLIIIVSVVSILIRVSFSIKIIPLQQTLLAFVIFVVAFLSKNNFIVVLTAMYYILMIVKLYANLEVGEDDMEETFYWRSFFFAAALALAMSLISDKGLMYTIVFIVVSVGLIFDVVDMFEMYQSKSIGFVLIGCLLMLVGCSYYLINSKLIIESTIAVLLSSFVALSFIRNYIYVKAITMLIAILLAEGTFIMSTYFLAK